MSYVHICKHCDIEFDCEHAMQKFCSKECHWEHSRGNQPNGEMYREIPCEEQDARFVAAMIDAVDDEMEAALAAGVPEHIIPQLAERYEQRNPIRDYTPVKLTPLAEFGAMVWAYQSSAR